jgi:hypothetical protein
LRNRVLQNIILDWRGGKSSFRLNLLSGLSSRFGVASAFCCSGISFSAFPLRNRVVKNTILDWRCGESSAAYSAFWPLRSLWNVKRILLFQFST